MASTRSEATGHKRGKTKRKQVVHGHTEDQLLVKSRRLSEVARLWPFLHGERSVPVLPTDRAELPHENGSPVCFGSAPSTVLEEKTTHTDVLVDGNTIKVTITKESTVVQVWIEQQTGTCFGLDVEWAPNRRKGQQENKVALMQISSESECLLVQMLLLDSMPRALVQFLKDPERNIIGVGIDGDIKKLHRDFGLVCGGAVELTTLAVARLKDAGLKKAGLKILAQRVLGFHMNKSKAVTLSNWAMPHLETRQVEYACIDAWVSHAIFKRLHESRWTQMRWSSCAH